ncbi:MAG: ASCH domain-containing protein [Coriobacteriia bacterium]|nr:ASCH domain-containing protein [Coriobacteriia bacterium]
MSKEDVCIEKFWQGFLKAKGLDSSTPYYESFYFANEEWADILLGLVIEGTKTATCGCKLSYEAEEQQKPRVGDYSIVTDFSGVPHCVIQVTKVTELPFNEVTWDMAKLEGEDEVLKTWQDGHRHFFQLEAEEYGFTFTEDTPVIFENFEVVYRG